MVDWIGNQKRMCGEETGRVKQDRRPFFMWALLLTYFFMWALLHTSSCETRKQDYTTFVSWHSLILL